jgi:2-oxoglutarate ferredoxin oxidoreductase subunit alpha
MTKKVIQHEVVIRLCGDSGDGVQLVGSELANTSALMGNDIGTLPDFPAEIRAPRGSIAGVSGYQLNIGSYDIHTPGDDADCLVAFNPAALKSNLHYLKKNGTLIVDVNSFADKNLKMAGYTENPLVNGSLEGYQVLEVEITENTRKSLADTELSHKAKDQCKNFYSLGLVSWLYNRSLEHSISMVTKKFKHKPEVVDANVLALRGGFAYGEMSELSVSTVEIPPAHLRAGTYRSISGNLGIVYGLLAASEKSGLKLFYAGYPITPASDILHELFKYQEFDQRIFQAEDEIAAICAAIGASYTGAIGVTASSGPGISLKSEALNLAVMTELPLVVIDVQRAGPSTGMPTKTEQSDLFQALFGRSGDSQIPVIAPSQPSDAFEIAYEAVRIAIKYRTPVMMLSDSYIGNGAQPWRIPDTTTLKAIAPEFATDKDAYKPYLRDQKTLARQWAVPGMVGFEHRIGGLEKENETGSVSYSPENHHKMTEIRAGKIQRVQDEIGDLYQDGESQGDLLVIGWGSTYGAIRTATEKIRKTNSKKITHVHLRWLNPLHPILGQLIKNFKTVVVPEMNMGQLQMVLRATFAMDIKGINQVKGLPFSSELLEQEILKMLGKN